MESKLSDQQQRALSKFGGESQMYICASELSELAGRIMQAASDIRITGKIEQDTLRELIKERHDVGFTLPQFDAYMRSVCKDYDLDLKVVEDAERVRMEERLK